MKQGYLSGFFTGVAVKRLSEVEVDRNVSNQREFNGAAPLRDLFGHARRQISATFIRFADGESLKCEGSLTWYDARERHPTRTEYRLYYAAGDLVSRVRPGDAMFIALTPRGDALVVFAGVHSTEMRQLCWLFDVSASDSGDFGVAKVEGHRDVLLDFVARTVLEEIGVEVPAPDFDLQKLLDRFGAKFPSSAEFSAWARASAPVVSVRDDPDGALMVWLEREEMLFRLMERHLVAERLEKGFAPGGKADVDEFIRFSLGVQNRRKARAGLALENHLEEVFRQCVLVFERGAVTENGNRPDFLFPGKRQYDDPNYPADRLVMLAAKASCKDRWRQVLNEAARIRLKYLLTLEPGISVLQTGDMKRSGLRLVLPSSIHRTFLPVQSGDFLDVKSFVEMVQSR